MNVIPAMKNNFSALVFSATTLSVVRVSADKTRLVTAIQETLPPGIIVSGVVVKKEELTKVIGSLMNKARIRDRTVGLIIPETQTFVKILVLPVENQSDLNEAVHWQMRDYLPNNGVDMIIDWRIISRTKGSAEVMVVAAKQATIQGYVDAVSAANLLPVVVETPAIALERLIPRVTDMAVAVFMGNEESLIMAISDGKILVSSAIVSHDHHVVAAELGRIIAHAGKPVAKLYIGGALMTQELAQLLSGTMKIPIEPISVPIANIAAQDMQRFLLALSLTKKSPLAPTSDATINLLPQEWAQHFRKEIQGLQLWTFTLMTSVISWSVFLLVFATFIILSGRLSSLQQKLTSTDMTPFNEAVAEVNVANKTIAQVLSIESNIKTPFEVVNKIDDYDTSDITVSSYSVNTETGASEISGDATSSAALLVFKNSLMQDKDLINVTLPLANLLNDRSTKFSILFNYAPYTKPKSTQSGTIQIKR